MKNITIIGAGLGGLTTGALLSKRGYSVTILEQHNIVGGCATVFKRKGGFSCEVGLHEMDGIFTDSDKKKIFDELGVYKNIEFIKPNEFFRVVGKDIDFVMPDSVDKAISALSKRYPSEKKSIKEYFDLIDNISKDYKKLANASWWQYIFFPLIFKYIIKYRVSSVKKVMDNLFKNEELKLILNSNIGYYNDKISDLSFLYHSIAQNSYFKGGGWYIKGGSQKLSNYLASIITQNGGKVITRANVIKIDNKDVIYKHKKEQIKISSDIIISNLAPSSTYKLANISYKEDKKVASSLLSIYIGFKQNLKSIYGKRAYSTFLFKDIKSIDDYDNNTQTDIEKRGFVFVDYSQIDSGLVDEAKSFGAICTTDYLSDWEKLSKDEYKQKKQDILESYLDQLEIEYPNIKDYIEFAEISTAKTIKKYIKTPNGTAYGFAPNNKQFFRIPQVKSKKLKNLYFVGAWVLGGGFTPAIISGGMCADEII